MTGPYTAHVRIGRGEDGEAIILSRVDFAEPELQDLANRLWDRGAAPGLLEGAERCSALWAMLALDPGQEAMIEIRGVVAGRITPIRSIYCRRDDQGRRFSTIGSRFGERQFILAGRASHHPARGIAAGGPA